MVSTEPREGQTLGSLFTAYRFTVGLVVPLSIVVAGTIGKKVQRGVGGGWKREDFYAGPELCLAGISGALVNLFEINKSTATVISPFERHLITGNSLIAFFGFICYYLTLSFGLDYGPKSAKPDKAQLIMMAGISNMIGLAVLFGALILMAT